MILSVLFEDLVRITMDEPLEDILTEIIKDRPTDNPFLVLDVGDIVQKIKTWRTMIPRVKIFYAVKCNDHPYILKLLDALGTGFDCASKYEFERICDMGIPTSRIIFANPCKYRSHISAAAHHGVDLMTFDNKKELDKIKKHFPNARLVLRIRCDADVAQCALGGKFGIKPELAEYILRDAKDFGLNVVGVSFHVGSGCQDPPVYLRAIRECRRVFDLAEEMGFNFNLLDIGGGYPGHHDSSLDEFAYYINKGLDEYFPILDDIEVIAEPGRYVVSSACTIVTKVTTIQGGYSLTMNDDQSQRGYYLNDGTYGSFNCIFNDHQIVIPSLFKKVADNERLYKSTLWGPTCDSLDMLGNDFMLPKLDLDDLIYWRDMGAYTISAATCFNGFPKPDVLMIMPSHLQNSLLNKIKNAENSHVEHRQKYDQKADRNGMNKTRAQYYTATVTEIGPNQGPHRDCDQNVDPSCPINILSLDIKDQ